MREPEEPTPASGNDVGGGHDGTPGVLRSCSHRDGGAGENTDKTEPQAHPHGHSAGRDGGAGAAPGSRGRLGMGAETGQPAAETRAWTWAPHRHWRRGHHCAVCTASTGRSREASRRVRLL